MACGVRSVRSLEEIRHVRAGTESRYTKSRSDELQRSSVLLLGGLPVAGSEKCVALRLKHSNE
jgi:hypothetical protein